MIKKVEVWEKLPSSRWPILVEKRTYFLGMLVYKFSRVEFGYEEVNTKQDSTTKEDANTGQGLIAQIEQGVYTVGTDTKEEAIKFESKLVENEVIEEAPTKKVENNKFKKHNNNK